MILEVYSEKDVPGLLRDGIGIMRDWKRDLEIKAPDMHFFIMATYDRGDMLINKEDFPDGCYSLALRFWAERNGNTVVNLEAFDEWDQPALLNEKPARKTRDGSLSCPDMRIN